MSRRIDICPTCKGKGEIIVDNWLTEGMTEEEIAKKKEEALVDIVEVVRCKDCIFYKANCCFNRQWDFESSVEVPLVRESDFCSYGERREE